MIGPRGLRLLIPSLSLAACADSTAAGMLAWSVPVLPEPGDKVSSALGTASAAIDNAKIMI